MFFINWTWTSILYYVYTGTSCWSVRRSTTCRSMMWDYWGRKSGAPAPSLFVRYPLAHEIACARTLAVRTGGYHKDTRGKTKPYPQVRAMREPSSSKESEHLSLCIWELQAVIWEATPTQDPKTMIWGKYGLVTDQYRGPATVRVLPLLLAYNRL